MSSSRVPIAARPPSQVLFETTLVQVGKFRCPITHPHFEDSGPAKVYCFVFPRTAVWIQHPGRAPFVADSTVVPLYNPGQPYRRRRISCDGDRTDWFGVGAETVREALRSHDATAADARERLFDSDFSRTTADTFLQQRRVFERVLACRTLDHLYVEEAVLMLLDQVLAGIYRRRAQPASVAQRHRALVEEARARLNLAYATREDLSTFAKALGSSAFHLCRLFKRQTGQSIHGYRAQLRLRRSLELLGDIDDILGIALTLGYSGHSHFTAAFHRQFGLTPSAYRTLSRRRRAAVLAEADVREQADVTRGGGTSCQTPGRCGRP